MAEHLEPQAQLATVTTSELSRSPRKVLERVAAGERLLVCWHKRPVATLQPLDGMVLQPLSGTVKDIYGRPMNPLLAETDALDEAQRALLRDGICRGRIIPGRLHGRFDHRRLADTMADMKVRGLAKRSHRGLELTGRGMMLRDALLQEAAKAVSDEL